MVMSAGAIKGNHIEAIKRSSNHALLIDEVNVFYLLTFLLYFGPETGQTSTSFLNTTELWEESDSTISDSQSISESVMKLVKEAGLVLDDLIKACVC